jgi:hypothetical protein
LESSQASLPRALRQSACSHKVYSDLRQHRGRSRRCST